MSTTPSPRATVQFVTGFRDDGKSVFEKAVPEEPTVIKAPTDGLRISLCYATEGLPIRMNDDEDLKTYHHYVKNPPGIVIPNGCAAKLVDFAPKYESPMHRSISLNYNFVIEGTVEVILDSGESKRLGPGDLLIQRAVNHKWRNVSSTAWAKITAISLPVAEFAIGDEPIVASHDSFDSYIAK